MGVTGTTLLLLIFGWSAIVVSGAWLAWLRFACPASMATRCPACHYPVDPGVGLRCPECGTDARTALDLHLRRRTPWTYARVVGLALLGLLCLTVFPSMATTGVWATIPNAILLRWGPTLMGDRGEAEVVRRLLEGRLSSGEFAVLVGTCRSMLDSSDQKVCIRGVQFAVAAEASGDSQAWDVLRQAFHHPSAKVRHEAMQAIRLSDMNCPSWMVEELCGILGSDGSSTDRASALKYLVVVPVGNEDRIAKAVLAAMRSKDRPLALLAATRWNELRISRPTMDKELEDMVKGADPWLRRLADYALGNDALHFELSRESQVPASMAP